MVAKNRSKIGVFGSILHIGKLLRQIVGHIYSLKAAITKLLQVDFNMTLPNTIPTCVGTLYR